jgi:hypothetical protein
MSRDSRCTPGWRCRLVTVGCTPGRRHRPVAAGCGNVQEKEKWEGDNTKIFWSCGHTLLPMPFVLIVWFTISIIILIKKVNDLSYVTFDAENHDRDLVDVKKRQHIVCSGDNLRGKKNEN